MIEKMPKSKQEISGGAKEGVSKGKLRNLIGALLATAAAGAYVAESNSADSGAVDATTNSHSIEKPEETLAVPAVAEKTEATAETEQPPSLDEVRRLMRDGYASIDSGEMIYGRDLIRTVLDSALSPAEKKSFVDYYIDKKVMTYKELSFYDLQDLLDHQYDLAHDDEVRNTLRRSLTEDPSWLHKYLKEVGFAGTSLSPTEQAANEFVMSVVKDSQDPRVQTIVQIQTTPGIESEVRSVASELTEPIASGELTIQDVLDAQNFGTEYGKVFSNPEKAITMFAKLAEVGDDGYFSQISSHWGELTPEQQAEINTRVTGFEAWHKENRSFLDSAVQSQETGG